MAQNESINYIATPDSAPQYEKGMDSLFRFIAMNIRYPEEARNKGLDGTVYVSFIVDTLGKILNAKVLKDIGGGCGEEAKRVLLLTTGKWNPGMNKTQKVNVLMNLPVSFRIMESKSTNEPGPISYHHFIMGKTAYDAGDFRLAFREFDTSAKLNSKNADTYYYRGLTEKKLDRMQDACDDWKKAFELGNNEVDSLITMYCAGKK